MGNIYINNTNRLYVNDNQECDRSPDGKFPINRIPDSVVSNALQTPTLSTDKNISIPMLAENVLLRWIFNDSLFPILDEIVDARCVSDEKKRQFIEELIYPGSAKFNATLVARVIHLWSGKLNVLTKNLSDDKKEELLAEVIAAGHTKIVEEMLGIGVRIQHRDPDYTIHPVHFAITKGHISTVYAVVNACPEIGSIKDRDGETVMDRIKKRENDGRWKK